MSFMKSPALVAIVGAFAAVGVCGSIVYTAYSEKETSSKIDKLSENISALVEVQKEQIAGGGNAAEAAKEAIRAHYEEQRNMAKDGILKAVPAAVDGTPDDRHLYGNPSARFTLIEYSDFECPYCARFHDTPKTLVESSKGNLNWEFKHFPLSSHDPAATDLAIASECVAEELGNKAFWAFNMEAFKTTGGNGAGVPDLPGLVETIGMSPDDLATCMAGESARKRVNDDMQEAATEGVTGTPSSYIIDNVTGDVEIISGAQPIENVVQKLRSLASRSKEADAEDSDLPTNAAEQD